MKSNFFSNVFEDPQLLTESDDMDKSFINFGKISPFKLLYLQMIDSNKDYISLIVSMQQQVTESL